MAKLYFYFGAMNSGKSTFLVQANHNYLERGMSTKVFTPEVDDRVATGRIQSRIGIWLQAHTFSKSFNFYDDIEQHLKRGGESLACILIDEAQFLSEQQVDELVRIVDYLKIPVLTYGLRTDFRGHLFTGSGRLLAWADELRELKTMCHCGRKAIMNIRVDEEGNKLEEGPQILIGGNALYVPACRLHFQEGRVTLFEKIK